MYTVYHNTGKVILYTLKGDFRNIVLYSHKCLWDLQGIDLKGNDQNSGRKTLWSTGSTLRNTESYISTNAVIVNGIV